MKFKDYNPRYSVIELMSSDRKGSYYKILEMAHKGFLIRKYGEGEILSVQDYDNTNTTGIIILDDEKYDGILINFGENNSENIENLQ